jgi:hypothetical protein
MMASQVNGGTIDTHTFPCCAMTITVAETPPLPLTDTLRCTAELA